MRPYLPRGSAVADLNEKAFITHTGKVAPRNANFGQIFSSDLPVLPRKCHRALPKRGLRAAGASLIRSVRVRTDGFGVVLRGIVST